MVERQAGVVAVQVLVGEVVVIERVRAVPPLVTSSGGGTPAASADRMDVRRERAVIGAVLGGDVDGYAELVDAYQGLALRVAFSLLGNDEEAKEASQEAFVRAYRSLKRFRGRSRFSTWLCRIVVNECSDRWRRRSRRPEVAIGIGADDSGSDGLFECVADAAGDPSDQLARQELARDIGVAIAALPRQQRTAFLLHHVHGVPIGEVAVIMRCRGGTVKAHLFRATRHLQRRLAAWIGKEMA